MIVTSESVGEGERSGWSSRQFCARGEVTSFSLRTGTDFRLRYDGVDGVLNEDTVLWAASRDGVDDIDSLETDRDDRKPASFSSSTSCRLMSSSSASSAGSSRMSNGDLCPSDDGVPSSCLHSFINSSMDTRVCCELRRRCSPLGGGIAVTARSAATAGGRAFGS